MRKCFVLFFFLVGSLPVDAIQVKLGKQLQFRKYKLAIPHFQTQGVSESWGKKIAEILRNNFQLTGRFRVPPPSSYLEKDSKGIEPNQFSFSPWRTLGVEGVLKGSVTKEGGQWVLRFRFYEVGSQKLGLSKTYKIPTSRVIRWCLHLFSEKLYFFLTKEKGIFTTKIAAIRNYAGSQEVWVMDFDGNNAKQITNNGSVNALPAWSPKKHFIAYTSWKLRNPDIFVLNLQKGNSSKLSRFKGLNTGAAWSPDGSKIAFSASKGRQSMDIYVMDVRSGSTRQLTRSGRGVHNLSPSWSPDGSRIAFVSTRAGSPQVYTMSLGGNGVQRLTFQGKYNQSPKWSPKGDWILFTGRDERNVFDLFLVSPSTKRIKRLTQNQGANKEACWTANGRNIVFASNRSGVSKLFLMTDEGKSPQKLTYSPGRYETPTCSPSFAY